MWVYTKLIVLRINSMNSIEEKLKGGHPNSLGKTLEVVKEVLASPHLFEALFDCYHSEDEIVRLRTSNAIKRLCKERPELLHPYIPQLIEEISTINQASTQWTLAQLFFMLKPAMRQEQIAQSIRIMKTNLTNFKDWIVINQTIETLAQWAQEDENLREWLIPKLKNWKKDPRKSVSHRAEKWLKTFG